MASDLFKKSFDNLPVENEIFARLYLQILKRVNYLLEQKGYKQKKLAENLGKKESEISKWLNGEHNLTLKSLAKLQAALGEDIISVPPVPSIISANEQEALIDDWEVNKEFKLSVTMSNHNAGKSIEFERAISKSYILATEAA